MCHEFEQLLAHKGLPFVVAEKTVVRCPVPTKAAAICWSFLSSVTLFLFACRAGS